MKKVKYNLTFTREKDGRMETPHFIDAFNTVDEVMDVADKFAKSFFKLAYEDQMNENGMSESDAIAFTQDVVLDYYKSLDIENVKQMFIKGCDCGLIARLSFAMGTDVFSFYVEKKQ